MEAKDLHPNYKKQSDYPEHGIRDVREIEVITNEVIVETQKCENCFNDCFIETMTSVEDGYWLCEQCIKESEKE